jgi:hypothetical protein
VRLDKVAKGTFYFDHSAGADLAAKYEVRTVDGAGNTSEFAVAAGPAAKPSRVYDDADLKLVGHWTRSKELQPAHAGTVSETNQKGATAELSFEGKSVLVFAKLGANCGKASVQIDGGPAETVDTYSADDIWGVCVYRKEIATAGPHRLTITVTGQRGPRAKDAAIVIDGVRIAP